MPYSETSETNAQDLVSGRIPTKATLVVVPGHLAGQWPEEITKFTGKAKKVCVIKTLSQFNSLTIGDVVDADIIVADFSLLCNEKVRVLTSLCINKQLGVF